MNVKFKVTSPIRQEILEHASEWQARLWSEQATQQDINDCLEWRQAHPEHELAWQFVSQFDQKLQNLSLNQQNILLDRPLGNIASYIKKGGTLCLMLGLSLWIYQQNIINLWFTDYRTQVGEIKHIHLSDGTTIIIDSNSAVNVDFKNKERDIFLVKGQIWVETGHKYQRLSPLHVHYNDVEIQPLGTQFTVSGRSKDIQVAVYEGRVKIKSEKINPPLILESGHRVIFNPQAPQFHYKKTDEFDLTWTQNKLIVEQMPLCEFMQHLANYRTGYIYCDSSLQNLKVSGTYDIKQSDQILHNLSQILPIKVHYFTPYLVRVSTE